MATNSTTVKAQRGTKVRRKLRFLRTRARELKMIGKALVSTKHPILVHIIPMRRCNLDCGYCNEYDQVSKPVPLEEMKRRLDGLGDEDYYERGGGAADASGAGRSDPAHPQARDDRRDDHEWIFAEQG